MIQYGLQDDAGLPAQWQYLTKGSIVFEVEYIIGEQSVPFSWFYKLGQMGR